jgi:hypothetical protein
MAAALVLVYLVLIACSPVSPQAPEITNQTAPTAQATNFSIYLSDQPDQPLVSTADIVAYSRQTHAIRLTPDGYARVAQLRVPTSGLPFQVRVGGETIYSGSFWALYSSQSYEGVVIKVPLMPNSPNGPDYSMSITLGYPGGEFFHGTDPRSDPRIFKALEQAGKLQ